MRNKIRYYFFRIQEAFQVYKKLPKSLSGKADFSQVQSFCLFIGYPRSGHSLIGAILDAHPNMVMAHELDALSYILHGFNKKQVFNLIIHNSESFAKAGRAWTGYKYSVPNQWQGKWDKILVIGDKKGGKSTDWLTLFPNLLEKTERKTGTELKIIHTVRNPFDNISTRARKGNEVRRNVSPVLLEEAIHNHFRAVDCIASLKKQNRFDILDIRHEDIILDAKKHISLLCNFLHLDCNPEFIKDCSNIVFDNPHKSRYKVEWPENLIKIVEEKINSYDFLKGYTYDS
jgi:hypothetical protein